MSYLIGGLDPGKDGALVTLLVETNSGRFEPAAVVRTKDLLLLGRGGYNLQAMFRRIRIMSTPELRSQLQPWHLALVMIERQQPMPKQGVSSTYAIGYGYGLWCMALTAAAVPFQEVTATVWTKALLKGVPGAGKERVVAFVERALPNLAGLPGALVQGKRRRLHQGVADAAALALYGARYVAIQSIAPSSPGTA